MATKTLVLRNRAYFPNCIREFKEIKGICIGKCIDKNLGFDTDSPAHAHCKNGNKYHGWICLQYHYMLKEKYTLLHEVAHIIDYNKRPKGYVHGKKWREVLVSIGGTFKSYLNNTKKFIYCDFSPKYHKVHGK